MNHRHAARIATSLAMVAFTASVAQAGGLPPIDAGSDVPNPAYVGLSPRQGMPVYVHGAPAGGQSSGFDWTVAGSTVGGALVLAGLGSALVVRRSKLAQA
jgi:hypothetical protein